MQKYNVEFLKIGLIESFEILDRLLDYLLDQDKRLKIIWDPILKASAGFSFHRYTPEDQERLKRILDRVYLITRIRTNFTDYSEKESLPIGYKSSVGITT